MALLKGKKVLFFAPKFFGYDERIAKKLSELGADVVHYDERPENSFWVKAMIRINRRFIRKTIDTYYSSILKQTAGARYDYVFVVNLEAMTPEIVNELRKQQPAAVFILYMWDSIRNKKPAQLAFKQFDWCYSFDKNDADQLKHVSFRPLFFIDEYDRNKWTDQPVQSIGVTFIGTVHSDRYQFVSAIKEQVSNMGISTYFYMYFPSKILFYYKKLRDVRFIKAGIAEFMFKPVTAAEIVEKVKSSRVILDIQHPNQTGLTMRTIEMLGAGRKLITTNSEVKGYDFYNPSNILVIDRAAPNISRDFMEKVYVEPDGDLRNEYSLEGWIKEIFRIKG